MNKLNELYDEIEKISIQLEEEPKNAARRKFRIRLKINELKDERDNARRRHDLSLQRKCDKEIEELEKYEEKGYEYKFKSEIDCYKKEIINIILNYYKNGKTIEDIIKLENISKDIYENWFSLSNFGKNTGYLFIEEVEDDEYYWIYSNPINEISFNSKYLEELKFKIKENNEILYIFNYDLAKESDKRNLKIHQKTIMNKLNTLELSNPKFPKEIFNYLSEYGDKFNENQIVRLCEIMIKNPKMNHYAKYFNEILDLNNNYFDDTFYDENYEKIVDSILENCKGDNYSIDDMFSYLKEYANKFTKNQLIELRNMLVKENNISYYSDDFNHILRVNKNNIDSKFFDEFYNDLIDNHIQKLNNNSFIWEYELFNDLKEYADKFNKKQLTDLCNYAIFKCNISKYFNELNYILEINKEKFSLNFFDEFYEKFINIRIEKLDNTDLDFNDRQLIFNDLCEYADKFSKEQITILSNCVIEREYIFEDYNQFNNILKVNEDNFDINYKKIIDLGINKLDNPNLNCEEVFNIFGYLKSYTTNFSKGQLNNLSETVIKNVNLCSFVKDFTYILKENNFEYYEELCSNLINIKIQTLNNLNSKFNSKEITHDLKDLSNKFNEKQLNKLSQIVIDNVNICNFSSDLKYIFDFNTDKLGNFNHEKFYKDFIDSRIKLLDGSNNDLINSQLFFDLNAYSKWFTEDQINTLCEKIIENNLVSYFDENFMNFLIKNIDVFDESITKYIYQMIIDYKLNELRKLTFGFSTARHILGFLKNYASEFTDLQMKKLCELALHNDQIYNCDTCKDNLKFLLEKNKSLIDSELYNRVFLKNGLS
ncbi:MAG: hypothetical protein E7Z77_00655 [Methanobrevibacter sp.]|uniref:hypothetical protein n=1 Tax=Methanobrevibacter sp. TaxID=66852 RepID=UPI0025E7DF96|nr:hypothetical protein [Methanobrevibacter sp.]MBE6507901.1 hypothetical protein [Methanobrevibacter sp.]